MKYTQADVIRSHVTAMLRQLHTSLPAIVTKYDSTRQTVDVIIAISTPVGFGEVLPPPTITEVPVIFPSGSDWVMAGPVKAGDAVLLNMCMYSLDEYLNGLKGKVATPVSMRAHELDDCFAIVGVTTYSEPTRKNTLKDKFHIAQGNDAANNFITMDLPEGIKIQSDKAVDVKVGSTVFNVSPAGVTITGNLTVNGATTINGATQANGGVTSTGTILGVDVRTTLGTGLNTHTHAYTDNGNPLTTAIPNPI